MSIVFNIASTNEDFEEILKLQRENLFSSISPEQQAQQGFVFAEHTMELLKLMAAQLPQVIALNDRKVVGYNLAMPVSMRNDVPNLVPMFDQFERCRYKGKPLAAYRYIVGGQVCVHKDFRGQRLLSRLYHETRDRVSEEYELCATEVAARNNIGLKAHQKMGFEVIDTYHDGRELWKVVVWELQNKPAQY